MNQAFGVVDESPPNDGKYKPKTPSERPEQTLYEALLKLDYSQQQSLFQEFVTRHQIGACLIHGSSEYSPRWLMNRLIRQVPNGRITPYVKKIRFSRNTHNGSLDSICR